MAERNRRSLSNRTVKALSVNKDTVFWDRNLLGFGVRVYPSGAKVYVAQARGPHGSRRVTLGRHGLIGAAEARKQASLVIGRLRAGDLPRTRHGAPTVAQAAQRYLEEYVAVRCKPATRDTAASIVRRHIVAKLGRWPLAAVTPRQVADLARDLSATPAAANAVIGRLSHLYTVCAQWGLVPAHINPCRTVAGYRRRARERFLTDAEYERLGRVLQAAWKAGRPRRSAVAAIALLMLTGCRKNEILTLRWADVDMTGRQLRLPDAKTGPRSVYLSAPALRLLERLRAESGTGWVIAGRKPGAHLVALGRPWRRLRALADLHDLRLHDLRHSYASRALAMGEPLPMISKLLGHRRIESTVRYTHLARSDVHEAAARVAESLAEDIL